MRIFLKLVILLLSQNLFAECDFKKEISKVVSLSGSSTVILKELGLLQNKKLQGISVFNPITENEFKGTVYPGGIFLSHQALSGLEGSIVFFDESRDLTKIFSSQSNILSKEIKTRNLTPSKAIEGTLNVMSEFLSGCDEKIASLKNKVIKLQADILKEIPKDLKVVFYLGDFTAGRPPGMVMVNDGVVKWLIEEKRILTYPSSLAYVNWSAKMIKNLPRDTLQVAVKDSGRKGEKKIKRSPLGMTFVYPGALVPGLSQLEAFLFWVKSL
jgi:hypothetical protein